MAEAPDLLYDLAGTGPKGHYHSLSEAGRYQRAIERFLWPRVLPERGYPLLSTRTIPYLRTPPKCQRRACEIAPLRRC